jgi:hypothetical protein
MRRSALSSNATEYASKCALVLLGVFVLAALSSCAGKSTRAVPSARTYRDPSGDAVSSNMRLDRSSKADLLSWVDIRTVRVSSTGDRLITFAIAVPGSHGLGPDTAVPNTNSLLGAVNVTVSIRSEDAESGGSAATWAIGYDIGDGSSKPGHVFLEKSAGAGYRIASMPGSLRARFKKGIAELTVNATDLGIATQFDFAVATSVGSGVIRTDRAPNKGWWSYRLRN